MPRLFALLLVLFLPARAVLAETCPDNLDFSFRSLADERQERLCEAYAGKVLLVVNTASFCGFTPQFEGLEALYDRYRERGLVVLGFPSNDFAQEPGTEAQIQTFCQLTYDVEFPMFEKVHVAEGDKTHSFYRQLAKQAGGYPQWNFYKYLLDRQGRVIAHFPSRVTPQDPVLVKAIEKLL